MEEVTVTDEDRKIVLEAAMKVMPEGHYPTDAVLLVAHRGFEDDRTTGMYYTIIPTPMAPHEMRGFFEMMEEAAAERYDW